MAVLLHKRFRVSNGKVNFNFEVRTGLTVITGDSGTGKTRFVSLLRSKCIVDGIKSIIFIDWQDTEDIIKVKLNNRNKIIVIDSADVVLSDSDTERIKNDRYNQYIILGRLLARYGATKEDVAELTLDEKGQYVLWYYLEDQ